MKILDVPRSGSYAGITSSRNRFGQYVRNRRAPVQPIGTGRRSFIRSAFGSASTNWATLGLEVQEAWNAFAESHPITNSLGASVILTGHQMYVAVRTQRINAGQEALPDDPPASTAVHTVLSATLVLDDTPAFTVAIDSSTAGAKNLIAFSPPLSPGRTFPPRFWQGLVEAAVTTPAATNVLSTFETEFGTLTLGTRIFVKVTPVNTEGWTGTPLIVSAQVSEA